MEDGRLANLHLPYPLALKMLEDSNPALTGLSIDGPITDEDADLLVNTAETTKTRHTLRSINMHYHGLTMIPRRIDKLYDLEELTLAANLITVVPPQLGNLTELRVLNLNFNRLATALPPEFGGMTKLMSLMLSANRLTTLPETFTKLTNIIELWVDDNEIGDAGAVDVARIVPSCPRLVRLLLHDNMIGEAGCNLFPPLITELPDLLCFSIDNNPGYSDEVRVQFGEHLETGYGPSFHEVCRLLGAARDVRTEFLKPYIKGVAREGTPRWERRFWGDDEDGGGGAPKRTRSNGVLRIVF
jgi:hypothetical protein